MNENIIKQKRKLGIALGIFGIVAFAFSFLFQFLFTKLNLNVSKQTKLLIGLIINDISIYLIGYAVYYFIIRKVESIPKQEKKKLKFSELVFLVIAAVGGSQFVNLITQMLILIVKSILHIELNNNISELIEQSSPILLIIFVAIIGPIVEELIFRGTLLKKLRVYGDKTAIIYTAIAFGLFHQNIFQIPFAIACGLVFGYTVVKTNNIKYSIFLHMFLNSTSVLLSIFMKYNLTIATVIDILVIMLLVLLAVIFVPIKLTSGKVKVSDEPKYEKKNLYKNAGYIISLVIIGLITIAEAII